ncbi:MMPL family transporter [Aeromicrobium terrae]|uniref:MMPL family transporter n=1 Tax=Aeromicrobium terrae TaxID=2498846 RepID=A0A5C8NL63_9ACTN|nr:MMPL family transporter [Aeromicrobium terrae]TXL61541.1 MMPL family transporter [Aeromicrobium terrae]
MNPLNRLGLATARHPWRTIAIWVVALLALGTAVSSWGGTPQDDWDVPGARGQAGLDQLREHFPDAGGATAQVVVHDDGSLSSSVVTATQKRLGDMPHALPVEPPRLSADGDTALFTVRYDVEVTHHDLMGKTGPLEDATQGARDAGYRVELGGELPGTATKIEGRGELIGVGVALLLLVIAFGSVVAAGLPVAVALGGLAAGSMGVTILAGVMDVSTTAPTIASMVGLGVGIDYALLMVTRHLEHLRAGETPVQAAANATGTAGKSVVGAGLTVLVSLMGLRLAELPTYSSFGFATGITVFTVMVAAVTLVPALCAMAGDRLRPRRDRKARQVVPTREPLTARWVARVARRPLAWALAALVVLLALAAPALGMRTWPQDGGSQPTSLTTRQAHDLIAEELGDGANGPLTVVVDRTKLDDRAVADLHARTARTEGVAGQTQVVTSPDGRLDVWDIQPTSDPADEATTQLIDRLREDVLPTKGVEVTGFTVVLADISAMLADRLWVVVGFVVAMSIVLLMVMFRSVIVPLKAAAMNLLSVAAAYGVMTMVFQHGWGSSLLGVDHAVPVSSWVPILMFTVLFGLSMDYEVFLLSAVREDWLRTGDARRSVATGLASTGRVISMAAAIMVAVFLGFATESDLVVKMLGVGLAVAIALDATVVRLVLVPATMTMLGRWNWWFPGRRSSTPRSDVTKTLTYV